MKRGSEGEGDRHAVGTSAAPPRIRLRVEHQIRGGAALCPRRVRSIPAHPLEVIGPARACRASRASIVPRAHFTDKLHMVLIRPVRMADLAQLEDLASLA